jgi:2-polyprenyl-3-methyl-5-hydroxy-6-metoxy-1,4-benzoquinol methylase
MKNKKINITLGKPIDIFSLKSEELENFNKKIAEVKRSRTKLYKKSNLVSINFCPICQKLVDKNSIVFEVYGAKYIQCQNCSHCFISDRPDNESLEKFYSKNKAYHKTYVNKKNADLRVNQVAIPKAEWIINQFQQIYGRKPKSFLDIGAGGGHFVKAVRKLGLEAEGIEISRNGRHFCKEYFGFELLNEDFLKNFNKFKDYEVITFWGLIEHVPDPLKMLQIASKIISNKNGFVVAGVPRWDSFSTAVQKIFSDSIIRHLDPLGHIHCFTDASLKKAYEINNLKIVATWYFGMDAYELINQITFLIQKKEIFRRLKPYISILQKKIDLAKFSDEMVFVGIYDKRIKNKN